MAGGGPETPEEQGRKRGEGSVTRSAGLLLVASELCASNCSGHGVCKHVVEAGAALQGLPHVRPEEGGQRGVGVGVGVCVGVGVGGGAGQQVGLRTQSMQFVCACDFGYFGDLCASECPGGAKTPCRLQGTCDPRLGACKCLHGYIGADCSSECPGGHELPCNGRGVCDASLGVCHCEPGFSGGACQAEALVPSPVHVTCAQLEPPTLIKQGLAASAYTSPENARASMGGVAANVSRLNCVWWASGAETLEYTLMTASSAPQTVGFQLTTASQGLLPSRPSVFDMRFRCLQAGAASLWIQLVFHRHKVQPVEVFLHKECAPPARPTDATCTPACAHGECLRGKCLCPIGQGYWGPSCADDCPGSAVGAGRGGRSECSGHGRCDNEVGECRCLAGFAGWDCSEEEARVPCARNCTGHGVCGGAGEGVCSCDVGWKGELCQESICECSSHGTCPHKGELVCYCQSGWGGETCGEALSGRPPKSCPNHCSGRGFCDPLAGMPLRALSLPPLMLAHSCDDKTRGRTTAALLGALVHLGAWVQCLFSTGDTICSSSWCRWSWRTHTPIGEPRAWGLKCCLKHPRGLCRRV